MNIRLVKMSRKLMHEFYQRFTYDPACTPNTREMPVYEYDPDEVDIRYDRHMQQRKLHFAIKLDDQLIGDIYLKHIDTVKHSCEMGIHLVNDTYKGKGYGTQAERFILHYAFHQLHMDVVYADTRMENERSRHALEKAGFTQTGRANEICRFECRKSSWNGVDLSDSFNIA